MCGWGLHLMVENICDPELLRIDISDRTKDDPFMLQPGEFCLAETVELFNIPDDISAQFALKSSRARSRSYNHAGWRAGSITDRRPHAWS